MEDLCFSEPESGPSGRIPHKPRKHISKFKSAGQAAMGAQFLMGSDDWTHARRRAKTEVSGPTHSAILVHMQEKKKNRSKSVLSLPDERSKRRSSTPGPMKMPSLDSLATKLGLNTAQKRVIRVSWHRFESQDGHKGPKAVMERAFSDVCVKEPDISKIFVRNSCVQSLSNKKSESSVHTVRDHAGFFAWFLGKVVEKLDDDAKPMLDMIKEYGKAHKGLRAIGLRSRMWDKLGQVMVEHIVVQEAIRHYPEATKAWTVLTASLIDRLCHAFVQECKRK